MNAVQQDEFVSLFERHQAAIHGFILTMLPSLGDSEEVLQETSLTLWRRFDQYEDGTSFRNWAFQVAKFTAYNYARKLGRDRHRFSDRMMTMLSEHAGRVQEDNEAKRRLLNECIQRLPAKDREVLAACYRENSSIKEYALSVGRTPNAVTKQLGRIRKALLQEVQRELHGRDVLPESRDWGLNGCLSTA